MSGRNYFMIERRARLQKIIDMIKDNPGIEERKLKGIFILRTGAKGKTVDEYLRELQDADLIEREGQGFKTFV